jgi:hypothetical protein
VNFNPLNCLILKIWTLATINIPTRVAFSASLLDHIYVTDKLKYEAEVIPFGSSDHFSNSII